MNRITGMIVLLILLFGTCAKAQPWRSAYDSARNFEDQKKTELAIEYYIKANEILARDSFYTGTHAAISNQIGLMYDNTGKIDKAIQFYNETKQVREKVPGKESEEYLRICSNLNYFLIRIARYEEAEKLCLEANELARKVLGENNFEFGRTCRNLGMLYKATGRFEEGKFFLLEAQSVYAITKGKDKFEYASITNDLGALYVLAGLHEKAVEQLLIAKEIYGRTVSKESISYANACNNLGLVYKNSGEYEKSEGNFLEAIMVVKKINGNLNSGYALFIYNLADLYRILGSFSKAGQLYRETKDILEKLSMTNHPDYAKVCAKLGQLYTATLQYEEAESLLFKSLAIREKIFTKNHPEYAGTLFYLGVLYFHMGVMDKAQNYFFQAGEVYKRINLTDHPEYFNTALGLALVYKHTDQYSKATSLMREVSEAWKEIGKENNNYRLISETLGDLYWIANKPEMARQSYEGAIHSQKREIEKVFLFTSQDEQASFLENAANSLDLYYSFYYNTAKGAEETYDLSLSYRQIILSSFLQLRQGILMSGNETLIADYDHWVETRQDLAAIYAGGRYTDEDTRVLEDSANELQKKLNRDSPDFKKQQIFNATGWKNIRQVLQPGDAAVEFAAFQYYNGKRWTDSIFYIGMVITNDNIQPEITKLFEQRELDNIINPVSGQQQLAHMYSVKNKSISGKTLYDLIWKPLDQKLTGIHKIYFAPAGSLYKIAFAALPLSNTMVLGDKYELVQLNSTALVMETRQTGLEASDRIMIYGAIKYDGDSASMKKATLLFKGNNIASRSFDLDSSRSAVPEFRYLDGSAQEISTISNLAKQSKFSISVTEGINASEESIKSISGKNAPEVLHIATHGFFFPDPKTVKKEKLPGTGMVFSQSNHPLMRSGLALAGANNAWKGKPVKGVEDGILTAFEVSNMYLPNTKLTVLSACETGLGDIQGSEGVYGLQRAFKMAGVQNLVMSLWKVDDAATSEFMQEFYKNLFAKETIPDAFYKAQTILKNKYRNDPYKWAAWVLIR